MSAVVFQMIKPLAERLTAEYRDASPATVAGWPVPNLDHERADRFTAQSRRPRQPRFVAYWDVDVEHADTDSGET
jgi:hypothetical protein